MIRHTPKGFLVLSSTGKKLGSYRTLSEAKERLKQVEMFKHMKGK